MLTHETIKRISEIFCGDFGGFYTYKSGPKLVAFFSEYFGTDDIYGPVFLLVGDMRMISSSIFLIHNRLINFLILF